MEWLIVSGIVISAAAIAYILALKQISKHTFQCKYCSEEFKTNWKKLAFVIHSDNEYEIQCPKCSKKRCIKGDA